MKENWPSAHDIYLFHQGSLYHSYRMMGAHFAEIDGNWGVRFTVWAPHAKEVRVAGDFNNWQSEGFAMQRISDDGLWSLHIPGLSEGTVYKYELHSESGQRILKSDPYAFYSERRPNTASVVTKLDGFKWTDGTWRRNRRRKPVYNRPMNIYEVHLGSWKFKGPEDFYTYEEIAESLIAYVVDCGYTHIELLPLGEHPFDGSWGYQTTGYYSITSRYGTPDQFKTFVDRCHQQGIGVILDWVPGHFCKDAHGLRLFDGAPCYEYGDSRRAEKPLWGTLAFDYGRAEVMSFLISNAIFWMEQYHIDGLRVDAVASMLSYNFDKPKSMWTFNSEGGTDNLEAIAFLQKLNEAVFHEFPDALMIAEDSSDRPLVTAPTYIGGLGFNYKWNMGWMNDLLRYMQKDPWDRRNHHNLVTFSMMYAYNENFILPLSHDEVVHGKKSLLNKMPGDYWQKFANYRLFYCFLMAHPGKKLLFMGGEIAQFIEWKDRDQLDWFLLDYDMHRHFHSFSKEMNRLYQMEPALWELDHQPEGFAWIDPDNAGQSIISFIRKGKKRKDDLVVVCNFTPKTYFDYRLGMPSRGVYEEIFNSDDVEFGGSGKGNGDIVTKALPFHRCSYSTELNIPPLSAIILKKKEKQR
ncbi:1,4-alpha-glucan branching protein GlgB [Gorillibacterium massiliense]|uniref:1,4-alpha-glucan branching protein GlgB n=1 Tax=Gorillibacterium massiliense TaxID=1280390 RepID=UPI0004B7EA39|nr:1,4-alpha-glucan branching protein GlgB [Gorillibacterium massiliense]